MKECVRELILEVLIVEELRDSPLNYGHLQDGVDGWTLRWVLLQQSCHQVVKGRTVLLRDLVKLSFDDALCELVQ
jgi:hypothetical protein